VPLVRAGPGDLGAIVSHHLPLAEAPAAYDLLRRPGSPVVKAALVP
jgi:threonine dehydrogenase-like Zn-dependent dehydrogenase